MLVRARMAARDPTERHRASTPLELLFDLTFVVAVASAGSGLRESLLSGHVADAAIGYPIAFFAVWWAWVNFNWFASAYATEDVTYRLAVLFQMAGVLVVAVGIPRIFHARDFAVAVSGYVIMRLSMVGLWLRAASAHEPGRATARRYALGIGAAQVAWVLFAILVPGRDSLVAIVPLALVELAVPVLAERAGRTPWHHGHIAERYSLFTIIVLGEMLSAGALAAESAVSSGVALGRLAATSIAGLVVAFAMWWIYFDMPLEEMTGAASRERTTRVLSPFRFGYGHYLVFASAAAAGSGIALALDEAAGRSALGRAGTGLACTVPVACYVLVVWALHAPFKSPSIVRNLAAPIGVLAVLLASLSPDPLPITALVLVALVAVRTVEQSREARGARA